MLETLLSRALSLSAFTGNAIVACTAIWAFIKLIHAVRSGGQRTPTPTLRGPPNPSIVFGVGKMLMQNDDPASIYESWAQTYGAVYQIPSMLGGRKIVLYDPKALAHFHAKETWTYVRPTMLKKTVERVLGRGLFWADGESHKRQRKSLTPAFGIAAIRNLTPVFYDLAHKAKGTWNTLIELGGGDSAIIDVQKWMNHISLDTIGQAGFSHDFGALDGQPAAVTEILDIFNASFPAIAVNLALDLLAQVFPFLVQIPTPRTRLLRKLNHTLEEIAKTLLARTKRDMKMAQVGVVDDKEEKSVIELLIKGERAESQFHLSQEEVLSQIKVLLLAAYESTSSSMTWALIELSRNPDIQTMLRAELLRHDLDPTYEQLANGLPYLDAVVHETLRIHSPANENMRVANEDDIMPLSEPIRTESGELIENLYIAKGTVIGIPIASINCSAIIWGEDAKVFKPSRWLEDDQGQNGIPTKAREIQGHRHLLTFSDGPRICLGKNFAITEFKVVLSVLIKNFVFELRDGVDTKIEMARGLLLRPRVAGEDGCKVPLRVRHYMQGFCFPYPSYLMILLSCNSNDSLSRP